MTALSSNVRQKSIAVLPFVNMSASEENEYFSDGITEEIINALTRIPQLKVTSRTSSFFFKNKNIPITEIGEKLDVSLILEGSVRLAAKTMRITAQLIDAQNDFHFWSHTWDKTDEDIFGIQDEVSLNIAEKAREFLGHFEIQDHLVPKQTDNYGSYEWYLKGRFHFRKWNPVDAQKGVDYFRKALELDANHAQSLLGLSDALGFLAVTNAMDQGEAWSQASEAIQKALAINPNLPEGHYQLSNLIFFTTGDYSASLKAALQSYNLNPQYAEANQHLAFFHTIAGDFEKAKFYVKNALELDPLSPESQFFDIYLDYMKGDFSVALQKVDPYLAANERNTPGHSMRCFCLLKLGRYDEAIQHFDSVLEAVIVEEDVLGIKALAYAMKGDEALTEEYLSTLEERAKKPEGFRANSFLIWMYAILGRNDDAFAWTESELKKGSPFMLMHFSDPLLEGLKKDARYEVYHDKLYRHVIDKPTSKRNRPLIKDSEIDLYADKVRNYMTEAKPYIDPGLSLQSLAAKVGLNGNQLSWLINERLGKNFNSYINSFRIQTFKEIARHPKNAHLSIIGLAYESGFNSKTVFNTYFKKETGLTPKQWITQSKSQ